MSALVAIVIPNIIIGLVQLLLFVKLFRTYETLIEISANYLKQLTETCIDVIKKMQESPRS